MSVDSDGIDAGQLRGQRRTWRGISQHGHAQAVSVIEHTADSTATLIVLLSRFSLSTGRLRSFT
jgi:hypothetical protein